METRDIKGLLYSLEAFAKNVLEFDEVTSRCIIQDARYNIELTCKDNFQAKAGYGERVEQLFLDEYFDWETSLSKASEQLFARMEKTMKRPERELRFGLNLIGQSLEAGASYRTHVGLEFVTSMKREQEKTMLMLPDRSGSAGSGCEAGPVAESDEDSAFDQPMHGHLSEEMADGRPF